MSKLVENKNISGMDSESFSEVTAGYRSVGKLGGMMAHGILNSQQQGNVLGRNLKRLPI